MSDAAREGSGAAQGTREASAAETSPASADTEPGPAGQAQPGPSARSGWLPQPGWFARLARRHGLFGVALAGATALRIVVMLGYPPAIWFHDSYSYEQSAVAHYLSSARPGGYPIFMMILEPLHSFALVTLLQHLMGLGIGVAVYAVLRRRGLSGWLATLLALPVLYDAYQVQLEQMIMSDVLFMVLVVVALVLLCWSDKPGWITAAVAGVLIGYATLVRSDGLPMLALVIVCLLLRRAGWRPLVALIVAGLVPIAGYVIAFHSETGQFAMTDSDGVFLYGRVSSFANCAQIKPPASLADLCDHRPVGQRPIAVEYIWDKNPLYKIAHNGNIFSYQVNRQAKQFAEKAIEAQPLSYLAVVAHDTSRAFFWNRTLSYDRVTNSYYVFSKHPPYIASWRPWQDLRTYQPSIGQTRAVEPFAGFLIGYQKVVYFRGVLLGLVLLLGLGGVLMRWRRWGGVMLLPWLLAMMLLVFPIATSGFSYRYELSVVPVACIAAGLALTARKRSGTASEEGHVAEPDAAAEPDGSGRGWPAKVGRQLRRRRPVEQE
ncbi:MAG TPA: hypothetical protein VGH27_22130 [Streptosporangiaceae bacterium]